MSRPFIPQDKPKSWVIFVLAVLIGLLVFGPIGFLGAYFEVTELYLLAAFGFMSCWLVAAVTLIVFFAKLISGKYRNLPPRPWSDQVW